MNRLSEIWHWLTTSAYTRELERATELLESQVDQLRRDNRALMNSLLGTAGVPPVEQPERLKVIPRLRRRSLHQLYAARTAASARRVMASTTEEHSEEANAS